MISEERIAELWRNTVPTWVIHAEVYGGIKAFARAVEAEAVRAENEKLWAELQRMADCRDSISPMLWDR